MSIENTSDSTAENGSFEVDESSFYGQTDTPDDAQEEQASPSEEDEDDQVEADATTNDEDTDGVDTPENEDETDEGDEQEETPKPRKNRVQERIDELTAKAHAAERRSLDLEARLLDTIAKLEKNKEDTPAASKPVAPTSTTPQPDDLNEDGTEKYALGEFDPQYIRDLTRHTIAEESALVKARDAEEREQEVLHKEQTELITNWSVKLEEAETRYPNIKETNALLEDTFRSIDPSYGKYLAATIMSMEYGPDVLDYLGNNLDEAQRIVKSGATKAVLALGEIQTKYRVASAEKAVAKPRVSKAPAPPPTNKGSAASMASVPLDTDDLDAFAAQFDQKKRKA